LKNGIDVAIALDNSRNNSVKTSYFSRKKGLVAELKTSQYYSHADDIVNALFDAQTQTDPETSKNLSTIQGKEQIRRKNFRRALSKATPRDQTTLDILGKIEKWCMHEKSLVAQSKVNDILNDEIYDDWQNVKTFEEAHAFFASGKGKSLLKIVEHGHFYHVRTTVLTWIFYKLFPEIHVITPNPRSFIKNFPASGFIGVSEGNDGETTVKFNVTQRNEPDDSTFNNFWFFNIFASHMNEKTLRKIEEKSLAKRLGMTPASFRQLEFLKVTPIMDLPQMKRVSVVDVVKKFVALEDFVNDNAFPLMDIRMKGKLALEPKKELNLGEMNVETVRFLYADIVPAMDQPFTVNITRDVNFLMDAVFENIEEIWLQQLTSCMQILMDWETFTRVMANWLLDHMYYREEEERYGFVFSSNVNFGPTQKKKFSVNPIKKGDLKNFVPKEELVLNTYYNSDFWSDLSYVRNENFYLVVKKYITKHFETWFRPKMPFKYNVDVVMANPPFNYEIDRISEIALQSYPDDGEEENQGSISSDEEDEDVVVGKRTMRQQKLAKLLDSTRITYDLVKQTISVPLKMQRQ
jgi:hypothetical protein